MTSFLYIAPLFLYFPRFLPGVETQPLLATLVALVALLLGRERRAALGFAGLAWAMLFWIAVKTLLEGTLGNALGLVQLLIGPLFLFGAMALRAPPPSRRLMAGVGVYFMLCMVIELLTPGVYESIASALLSRATVADGHRGVSLLTPEPTYASISVMYFVMLAWWSGKHWGFRHRWIEPLLALSLFATGSTYVGLMLMALAFVRWPRLMIAGILVTVVAIPSMGVVALANDDSIRAVVALSRLLSSDFSDLLPSISIVDSSLGSRLTTNAASFLTPLNTPLGLGLDCKAVPAAFSAAGYDFAFDNAVLSAVMDDGCLKPQSYAATISLGLGSLAAVFLVVLAVCGRYALGHRKHMVWLPPAAIASVILIVQGQLTNPIPWLLIFMAMSARRYPPPQPRRPAMHGDIPSSIT
ncbi:hypothetical protein [Roseateles sp.]|uniref:hypothetical protein n=1 Tax=Roseateles sp. TaxID=1971397 RepID=UPI003BA50535